MSISMHVQWQTSRHCLWYNEQEKHLLSWPSLVACMATRLHIMTWSLLYHTEVFSDCPGPCWWLTDWMVAGWRLCDVCCLVYWASGASLHLTTTQPIGGMYCSHHRAPWWQKTALANVVRVSVSGPPSRKLLLDTNSTTVFIILKWKLVYGFYSENIFHENEQLLVNWSHCSQRCFTYYYY